MVSLKKEGDRRIFLASSIRYPATKKHYTEMVYLPMVELLDYLRANGYKTFIVSGGGIDFMRVWTEKAYGIPSYQVVGSSVKAKYEVGADIKPFLNKLPELVFNEDKEGKPVGIHQYIGKRPVFTVGNSDGDYQMLQYTTAGSGPRFGLIVHHTDNVREVAYDRDSHWSIIKRIGRCCQKQLVNCRYEKGLEKDLCF